MSSHLVNRELGTDPPFVWEVGYGLFTLGPRQLTQAVAYVRQQKEHHNQETTNPALEQTDDP